MSTNLTPDDYYTFTYNINVYDTKLDSKNGK